MPATATWVDGLYYGALAVLAVYHLAVWATLRERIHLLYVAFVASLGLSSFVWDGFGATYLWPGQEAFDHASWVFTDALAALFGLALGRAFLGTAQRTPQLDRMLRGVMALAVLGIPLSLPATWALGIEWMGAVTLVGPPALLAAGFVTWRAGYAPARVYLLAQGCLLAGLTLETAADYVLDGGPAWTEYGTYAGPLLMAFVVSRGLAVRYRDALAERDRLAAERDALERASLHDGLTGIWNRRRFDAALHEAWRRAFREDAVLSVVLLDVDFFKPFNDTAGHTAGDDVLRRVARCVAQVPLRPDDLVARYGGEEFVALLPDAAPEMARGIAEAMRAAVEALGIAHPADEAGPCVTISVGVGSLVPDEDHTPKQLVDAADGALYEAKAKGRNRVCVAADASAAVVGD